MQTVGKIIKQENLIPIKKPVGQIQLKGQSKTFRTILTLDSPINAATLWLGEIDSDDLRELCKILTLKFSAHGEDYENFHSLRYQKAKDVWETAISKNMSKKEFQTYIRLFSEGKFYDSGYNEWQKADFFNQKMKVLYTQEQVQKLRDQTGDVNIFGKMTLYKFDANGQELILYSESANLPFEKYHPIQPKIEEIIYDIHEEEINISKKYLEFKVQNIDLREKILKLENVIENQKAEISKLKNQDITWEEL